MDLNKKDSEKLITKYPDRIPCILITNDKNVNINKSNYLVPKNMKFNEFIFTVRKNINIEAHEALFFTINNTIPSSVDNIFDMYDKHKNEKGFLYINISKENTFG